MINTMDEKERQRRRQLKKRKALRLKRKQERERKIKRKYMLKMGLLLLSVFSVLIVGIVVASKREKAEAIRIAEEKKKEEERVVFDYGNAIKGLTLYDKDEHTITKERADELLLDYATQCNFDEKLYTKRVKDLLMNHFEARDFVFNYPLYYGTATSTDAVKASVKDIDFKKQIPELYQWDMRWGYKKYGSDAMGLTGCGPTALSMVAMYMLKSDKFTPDYIADFALENGYAVEGSGTSWNLMDEGAMQLGLYGFDVLPVEDDMATQLLAGRPLICIMGPGHFTNTGHFIVIKGYEVGDTSEGIYKNGKFLINDPNCKENTQKKWSFDELQNEIGSVWAYTNE